MYVKATKYNQGKVDEVIKGRLVQTRNGQAHIDTPTGEKVINLLEWIIIALPLIERIAVWAREQWNEWFNK